MSAGVPVLHFWGIILIFHSVNSQLCPFGWHSDEVLSKSCYLVTNNIQRTWNDALTFCTQMGGSLLKIDTAHERDWVLHVIHTYQTMNPSHEEWWLGLHDNAGQTGVLWSDKSTPDLSLLKWAPGEPQTYDRADACVSFLNGSLQHQDCQTEKYFVCERRKDSAIWCDTQNRWESVNDMCYKSYSFSRNWDGARAECQKAGGDMFVVKDKTSEAVLHNFLESRRTGMWIGLRAYPNAHGDPVFEWNGQTPLLPLQSFWSPDVSDPKLVALTSNYSGACVFANNSLPPPNIWTLQDCNMRSFFLCQKPHGSCAAGWLEHEKTCYFTQIQQPMGWNDANYYCQTRRAKLLQIHSSTDQTYVDSNIRSYRGVGVNSVWLGLTDNNRDGADYVWGDGSPHGALSYSNFAGNHDNRQSVQDCFEIFTDEATGAWHRANNCSEKKAFVCTIPINIHPREPSSGPGSQVTTPTPVTWTSDCGPFWVEYPLLGTCYQLSDQTMTWSDAKTKCESMGSQLASITSYEEGHFLVDLIWDHIFGYKSPALWIGMNNLNQHQGFSWIDGSGFGYFSWAPGEPNNFLQNEHCGELVTGGEHAGFWNDVNCDSRRGYICKKLSKKATTTMAPTTPAVPAGSVYDCPNSMLVGYGQYCYLFSKTAVSWIRAKLFCESHSLNLASIHDENEQNFIFSQLPRVSDRARYWIGLNDHDTQMNFVWTDDSSMSYTNWAKNEPNNFENRREDCIAVYAKDGYWNDETCDNPQAGFICKTPKVVMATPPSTAAPAFNCSIPGAIEYSYLCFKFMDTGPMKSFSDAEKQCRAYAGGSLATIHDSKIQAFLASQMSFRQGYYWIGLHNTDSAGAIGWSNGDSVDFAAWSANHTGRENNSCVGMTSKSPVGLWWNLDCMSNHRYICQSPRAGYFRPTTAPPFTTPGPCDSGWREYNGYCYKAFKSSSDRKSWFDARDTCRVLGADLLSLHSSNEESFVFSYSVIGSTYNSVYWIGLNDFATEKGYEWLDGSPVTYTNWGSGEPNDASGEDDCVEYSSSKHNWNDNNCFLAQNFVCKIRKGLKVISATPPSPTVSLCDGNPNWLLWNGSCYYLSTWSDRKTWYDARKYCNQNGGDLVSIHSEQENGFIVTQITSSTRIQVDRWIGFVDVSVNTFSWSDDSSVDFIKWSGNEPNDAFGSEKCTQMSHLNGYWNDNDCNEEYAYVCKRPAGHSKPVTIAPTPLIPGGCPPGFQEVPKNNKCFKVFGQASVEKKLTYVEARNACRALGDFHDLASINSAKEQAALIYLVNGLSRTTEGVYIGLNDQNNNDRFTWQDSAPLRFTNWDKGEPRRSGGSCVEMFTDRRRAGKWRNINCLDVRAYICEAPRNASFPVATQLPSSCKTTGYESYSIDCYKLDTKPRTWQEAERSCQNDGNKIHLTAIQDVYEKAIFDLITSSLTEPVWIGLSDTKTPGTYQWSDNWSVHYSSWDKDEPTYLPGGGCVVSKNGRWNDTSCSDLHPSVCKDGYFKYMAPTPSPGGYCKTQTWRTFDNYCYYIELEHRKNWADADSACTQMGMQMASIHSIEEESFILHQIDSATARSVNVWIAMRKTNGLFTWSDGTSIQYIDWNSGEPSDLAGTMHEDCVELQHEGGKWNDLRCSSRNGYVCKTPKLAPTLPPPTSTTTTITTSSTPAMSHQSPPAPSKTSKQGKPTLPTGFVPMTESPPLTRKSQGPGFMTPTTTKGTEKYAIPTGYANPGPAAASASSDLSGGQIAGVVIGVLLLLVLVAAGLLFAKRRYGYQMSFQRFRNSGGITNALYDKSVDEVKINGHLNESATVSNGHTNIGFQDFTEHDC